MYCTNRKCPDYQSTGIHGEYREGITQCPYCGEALAAEDPAGHPSAAEPEPEFQELGAAPEAQNTANIHGDLEPVFESSDPTEIPVVRSFLDSHGIPHVVVGEERQQGRRRRAGLGRDPRIRGARGGIA